MPPDLDFLQDPIGHEAADRADGHAFLAVRVQQVGGFLIGQTVIQN
jgi:hypothetical protein